MRICLRRSGHSPNALELNWENIKWLTLGEIWIMQCMPSSYHSMRSLTTALWLLVSTQAYGFDTYDQANNQLTIPTIAIGGATFSNMVITVGTVLSGPTGTTPNARKDSYNPLTGVINVPAVMVGADLKYNYTGTIAGLVSIGGAKADTLNGNELTIASVQVDGTGPIYTNVVITITYNYGAVGGIPLATQDQYSSIDDQLSIPALQEGDTVYTNVTVDVGKVLSVGGSDIAEPDATLYSFRGSSAIYGGGIDGEQPNAGLILGTDGTLYGTTYTGGLNDYGTVFKITPAGDEVGLYSFGTGTYSLDGSYPHAGLIQGSDGNFYGTATRGGANDTGAVFKLTPASAETALYEVAVNGELSPVSLIQGSDGNLYGTMVTDGNSEEGTVFQITPSGVETVLYYFSANVNTGLSFPQYPLGLIQGSDGDFYGMTLRGGQYGSGSVFRVTPAGAGTVLYSFGTAGSMAGSIFPSTLLQGSDGNFYGTTDYGGQYGEGTVFGLTPAGVETVLYNFGAAGSTDGTTPSSLIQGSDGNFYGTTFTGGQYGEGTVYGLTPAGVEMVIHSFSGNGGVSGSVDGAKPLGLVEDSSGSLYGTTLSGGVLNYGTVFKLANVIPVP